MTYAKEFVSQFLDFIGKHPIPVKRTRSSNHPLKYAEPVRRGWKRGGKTVLPNPTAVLSKESSEGVTFATLLYPVAPGKNIPSAKIAFVPVTRGRDAIAVQVTVPGKKRMTLVDQVGRGEMQVNGQAVRGEMGLIE